MSSDKKMVSSESSGAPCLHLRVNPASIRAAPPVVDQPAAVLLQWRIVRLYGGGCVLVGCPEGSSAIRITTTAVRKEGRQVWTMSGRRYQLQYDAATDKDMLTLLCERLATSGHFDYIDVTEQFLAGTLKIEPHKAHTF